MVANSETSVKNDKPSTSRTGNLTPGLLLEILEEAVNRCQKAGIKVGVAPFHDKGARGVVIVLEDVDLGEDRHLHIATNGSEDSG